MAAMHRSPERVLDRSDWDPYMPPRYIPVDDHRSSWKPDLTGPAKPRQTPRGLTDATNEKSGVVGWRTTRIEAIAGVFAGERSGAALPHPDTLGGGIESWAEPQTKNGWMEAQSGSTHSWGILRLIRASQNERRGTSSETNPETEPKAAGGWMLIRSSLHCGEASSVGAERSDRRALKKT